MQKNKFPSKSEVHCVELITGQQKTGYVKISEKRILASIFSYDYYFDLSDINPLFLRTSDNQIVSLYGTHNGMPSTSYGAGLKKSLKVNNCKVDANFAIVGNDKWDWTNLVKRCQFSLPKLSNFIEYTKQYQKLKTSEFDYGNAQLISASCNECIVRYRHHVFLNFHNEIPSHLKPFFELEFKKPKTLKEYMRFVKYFTDLASIIVAFPVEANSQAISELSKSGYTRAVNRERYQPDFSIHFRKRRKKKFKYGSRIFPALLVSPSKIQTLRKCIIAWINRMEEWEIPNSFMRESLLMQNEFSAERLVNACRWLESIPEAKSKIIITKEHGRKIAKAATKEAVSLGYSSDVEGRIPGALSQIKKESHEKRFQRLLFKINKRFSHNFLPDHFIDDLKYGIRFRNQAAHDIFMFESHQDYLNALRGMHAIEVFCFLLTICDLPIHENAISSIVHDHRVQNYLRILVSPPV